MSDTQQLPLSVQPVISYPREAQVGKTYLMTIDLQPSGDGEWLYEEEEYPIYCMLDTSPLFTSKPVGEPAVVLHRFGGSYGVAKFLLTAAQEEMEGEIRVTLVNGWGVPLKVLSLKSSSTSTSLTPKPVITETPSFSEPSASKQSQTSPLNWISSKVEEFRFGLNSGFERKYYQDLRYTYRSYRTQGLKTPGKFIPDLDKMFVPLQVASKSPALISPVMIQKQESAGNLHIWDFLADIGKQPAYKRIVVIGAPGSGKTTLLECLTLTYAQNLQHQQHRKAPKLIPILLRLRQIHEEITRNNSRDLAQLVTYLVRTQESPLKLDPPTQWFEERLKQGKCLVMLDGLDEVANETQRQRVSQWVDRQMRLYPETSFIVTSRPFGYRNAPLGEARLFLEVQPYNLHQIEQYINKWYLQNEIMRQVRKEDPGVRVEAKRKANDLIRRIKNYAPLADMAQNPLLLTMMATVHDNRGTLPGSRRELYAAICEVLLLRRQDAKGIRDEKIKLRAEQKQSVLQVLALELMKRNSAQFTLELGKELIKTQLAAVSGMGVSPEDFIKYSEQISGLLVEKDAEVYAFYHFDFQEYLAAVQIEDMGQEEILIANIDSSWWRETIHLYAAGNDITSLVSAALKKRTVVSLSIALGCLKEGLSLDPAVRQQLEELLEDGLDSANSEMMELAAGIRLANRLKSLVRIDDKRHIDQSYITCAEYQLFIDEKLKVNEFYQPRHWKTNRFLSGEAAKPITGVRASDAEAFCEWLTQRDCPPEFKYRLPSVAEAEEHPTRAKQVGCWCNDGGKYVIVGIESEQLTWQEIQAQSHILANERQAEGIPAWEGIRIVRDRI